MNLWIRSQNKCSLTKVNNLYLNDSNDYLSINTDLGEYGIVELGEYKTKKRALEVLDEIEELFRININGASYEPCDLLIKAKMLPMIYEMPEK